MNTEEVFKVLITGCYNDEAWYADKIGDVIEVKNLDDASFGVDPNTYIKKSDCHVIDPWYEVAKQSEETGRKVELWQWNLQEWQQKMPFSSWRSDYIYRLILEPKQPEYEPYTYKDADKLRCLWVRSKSTKTETSITFINQTYVGLAGFSTTYQQLFDHYETALDGKPVGKLKL